MGCGLFAFGIEKKNNFFYEIIKEFYKITNVPLILNTSFNINGEPIVLTPDDALTTFYNSGLKYLFCNLLRLDLNSFS